MNQGPTPPLARLAVAVMTADGRITPAEQADLSRLDEPSLGKLFPRTKRGARMEPGVCGAGR